MSKTHEKFMIIDGNALIHRSFHALPPTMKTRDGLPSNAVYGFTTVLLKSIREMKPDYIALTLDKKGPTFRHKKFKEYKAKRVKAPDELYAQIPLVKDLAKVLNIPVFEKTGFEADDLIGTLSAKTDDKIENVIVTGDLDILQLIDDHTKVYKLGRGLTQINLFDADLTKVHYGIEPGQVIDYKALRGDPSDNIPGVRGVGEKTALALLGEFGDLDTIYKNLDSDKIKDRVKGLLSDHKKEAYLSQDLATIHREVKIDFDLEKLKFGGFRKDEVVDFISRMEFRSLLPRIYALFESGVETVRDKKKESSPKDKFERNRNQLKYHLIQTDKDFNAFIKQLKTRKSFTFDTETSGFDPVSAKLLGISFSWKKGEAFYLDVSKSGKVSDVPATLFNYKDKGKAKHAWLEKLRPVFEDEKIKKSAHNMKFDYRVLRRNGIETKGIDFDTMIASYLLNPGTRQHNLDALTFTELGFEKITKADLLGKGRDKITFSEVDTQKLSLYSCEDADFTHRLVGVLKKKMKSDDQAKLFKDMEMPLVTVLARMEDNGIRVDKEFLAKMSKKMAKKISSLEKKIHKQAGRDFNIKSTKQLKEVLFVEIGLPTEGIKKTKTGFSTAADELEKLKDKHPIILLIQEHRELCKLTSTYVDALPLLVNKKSKRVHTSFNQAVTATGRLSSTEPNLQNIPIRTELGREIRKAFVADRGYELLALDYSQIELRLAAHMSGDKKMIRAFQSGADIHTSTSAEINQVDPETVTSEMRREAKAINFGILYGQGPHGLSRSADIPFWRAREFIEQYFIVYKNIEKYIEVQIKEAQEKGFVETLFGRRRYFPDINSSVAMVRKAAERMAINAPLQGTSADITKAAMIKVDELIREKYSGDARMLLQVHDELVFEVKKTRAKEVARKVKKIMEEVIKLKVPVVVDAKHGSNWGSLEKLDI